MTDKTADRRILRTHQLLRDALIALMLEKRYETISIRDITERANIAYATFFRRYDDKDQLLLKILEGTIEELTGLLSEHPLEAQAHVLFQHVHKNQTLYQILLDSQGALPVLQQALDTVRADVASTYGHPAHSFIPPAIIANHIIGATLALVKWWLDNDLPYPPEEMGRIYSALVLKATRDVVGMQKPQD